MPPGGHMPQMMPGQVYPGGAVGGMGMGMGMGHSHGHAHGHGVHPSLMGKPHVHLNPHCHKCRGTGYNALKGRPCKKCVCKKCGGSGWNAHKNKPCKKFKH